jgi:hypothetical protein
MLRTGRDSVSHPRPLPRGLGGYAPDPVTKKKKRKTAERVLFLSFLSLSRETVKKTPIIFPVI